MRHRFISLIALPLVMAFLGCSSMSTTQKGAAIGGFGYNEAVFKLES
jgi:hypothetical protein